MAQRRMFSKDITASDLFVDMPLSSQLLYFHLGMEADDEGFIGNAKMLSRAYGSNHDDLKLLIVKGFLIYFDTGVTVVKDWNINNQIRKDRLKPTIYQDEKRLLKLDINGSYELDNQLTTKCQPNVNQMSAQDSIGKDSIVKDSNNMSSKLDSVIENTNQFDQVDNDSEVDSGQVSSKQKNDSIPFSEIVEYLNQKVGAKFRSSTPATKRLIKERIKEGFTIDDFKSVIDIKTNQWLNNQTMNQYLRPQTLFGTKFESYLNESRINREPDYLSYEEVELIGDDIELPF